MFLKPKIEDCEWVSLKSGYKHIADNRKALDQQAATTADRGLRVRPWVIRLAQDPMA